MRHGVDIEIMVNGQSIRLLSVHLKSSCFEKLLTSEEQSCRRLASQVPILEKWIDERASNGMPFVVMGDFNRRFNKKNDDFWPEIDDGEPAGLGLIRATEGFSSECWGGKYPDYIDHHYCLDVQSNNFNWLRYTGSGEKSSPVVSIGVCAVTIFGVSVFVMRAGATRHRPAFKQSDSEVA